MIGIGIGVDRRPPSSGGASFDVDAQAFFDRVTAAGGTLSATEQTAVNTLVLDLKANSLWTPMKAIYPMVGASAAACAQNLKSSSFTGTFTSGWTFASTGVTGNGTSAFFDTTLNPSTNLTSTSVHMSYYQQTESNGYQVGCTASDYSKRFAISPIGSSDYVQIGSGANSVSKTTTIAFYVGTRNGSTVKLFKNNSVIINASDSGTLPNLNAYLNTNNQGTGQNNFNGSRSAFASIGDGLTDTQASNLYTAVQAFQTTLNRQIAP
jgi:hypothetical protein